MKIIPVIDLKDGLVVHAKQGKRDEYQPLNTPLCQSADIYQVINAFLNIHNFDTFYIADLNAITGQGHHEKLLEQVLLNYKGITFWIDMGYQSDPQNAMLPKNYLPVLGSESYQDENIAAFENYRNDFILSLDFADTRSLGAKTLFTNPALWPANIIVMTLERVGSHAGPDLQKLHDFTLHHPGKHFIAAGGIRNAQDLIDLNNTGIHQALVASALHSGEINSDDIAKLQTKKYPD